MKNIKIRKNINIAFNDLEANKIIKETNLFHLGVENCNVYDDKKKCFVARFPEKETQELKDAHWKARAGFQIVLDLEISPKTGDIENVKVVKK